MRKDEKRSDRVIVRGGEHIQLPSRFSRDLRNSARSAFLHPIYLIECVRLGVLEKYNKIK